MVTATWTVTVTRMAQRHTAQRLSPRLPIFERLCYIKKWRSSPQSPEQEPPAAQQPEAIPGAGAAPEDLSHKEVACRECGWSYGRTRELGEIATKGTEGMAKKGGRNPKDYAGLTWALIQRMT